MADHTKIEWTEATWNPITGCSVVSAGCKNCYAMKLAGTRLQHHPSRAGLTQNTQNGPVWTGEMRFNEQWLKQPLQWKRPRKIFVCAHSDLFHESVPDEWIDRVFAVMALAKQHTFQVLTKRPQRMLDYMNRLGKSAKLLDVAARTIGYTFEFEGVYLISWPIPNVWIGVTVENQETANERIPLLMQTPAAVRWISAEPLLGAIDLLATPAGDIMCRCDGCTKMTPETRLDWVVCGGESGSNARPMNPSWAQALRDQCKVAGVPFLFKQWGGWIETDVEPGGDLGGDMRRDLVRIVKPAGENDGHFRRGDALMRRVTKKSAGRLLDGVLHDGYPTNGALL